MFVDAAQGWLELGDARAAAAELERVTPGARAHPGVLEARWRLLAHERRWSEALAVAEALLAAAPATPAGWISRSFALHELRRSAEARRLLLPAWKRFPKESVIAYNLACYACQLGDLAEARQWLDAVLRLRDRDAIRRQALDDPDLRPLWAEIEEW
jgi:Flp pilus assembly protein TadD